MPTPLDRALNSKNTFLAFTGIVTAVAVWSIWGQDMFPKEPDPTGNPESWTYEEMRTWLASVSTTVPLERSAIVLEICKALSKSTHCTSVG
ncbi:hypothetical protein B2J93_1738 [Marssonina coronariae]|uniref:Uncharacterized protein n=1 Tax=Diplocarpon coronariae TaxID=2795749 RepID=A0A218ZCA4_9HELO|nr:hypothetical protein B2J93_1738 [Marssonina coronariae]